MEVGVGGRESFFFASRRERGKGKKKKKKKVSEAFSLSPLLLLFSLSHLSQCSPLSRATRILLVYLFSEPPRRRAPSSALDPSVAPCQSLPLCLHRLLLLPFPPLSRSPAHSSPRHACKSKVRRHREGENNERQKDREESEREGINDFDLLFFSFSFIGVATLVSTLIETSSSSSPSRR